MNRKTLPRFLNRRKIVIEALVKARGNGGNSGDILYNPKSLVISNKLFKNSPSSIISTGDKPKSYKYSSKSVGNKRLGDRARDIYEDDWDKLETPSTKKRRYQ
jgi:hypothetical protein